jgi:preprotein translocase subunit YajC
MTLSTFVLLAQEAAPTGAPPTGTPPQGSPPSAMPMLIGLAVFFAIFYFVLMRGNRKQRRERQNLIANIAKNDRVLTIGGIIGTVASVRDNEVVVKVDESSNTKMTFLKSAIQKVITESDPIGGGETR